MPRLQDRLASLERRHAPPAPPPLVTYLDVAADFEAAAEQYTDAVAVLPVTPTAEEWERYAVRQQTESAAHAAAKVREVMGNEADDDPLPANVLPMTR